MRPRPGPLTILLAGLLVLGACTTSSSGSPTGTGQPAASASPTGELRAVRLLLSYRPDVQFAPFYVAQQAGYFADAGLDVTIEHADGGDLIRLVADGQADFGVADATDVMIARTSGIPVKYISTLYQLFPVAVIGPAGTAPTDPVALAGTRIGTPGPYGSSWIALLALLDAGGLTAEDVTVREYPQYDQVDGLLNGDVDLITGFRNNEPLRLEAAGMTTDQLTVDTIAPLPGPGVISSDELLDRDVGLAASFAAAIIRAQQAITANPQVGMDAALVAVPTIADDEATARAVLEATIPLWAQLIEKPCPPPTTSGAASCAPPDVVFGTINQGVWESGYRTMVDLGFIDGSVPLPEMTDQRVVGATS